MYARGRGLTQFASSRDVYTLTPTVYTLDKNGAKDLRTHLRRVWIHGVIANAAAC